MEKHNLTNKHIGGWSIFIADVPTYKSCGFKRCWCLNLVKEINVKEETLLIPPPRLRVWGDIYGNQHDWDVLGSIKDPV